MTFGEFNQKYLPALAYYLIGFLVLVVTVVVDVHFSLQGGIFNSIGFFLIYIGIIIILWAFLYMRLAVFAFIEARRSELITGGPYKYVRHPIYTGTIICLLGMVIVLRSLPGAIGLVVLFIPAAIYRGRAEDRVLARKFGQKWHDYGAKTGSLLPALWRKRNKVR